MNTHLRIHGRDHITQTTYNGAECGEAKGTRSIRHTKMRSVEQFGVLLFYFLPGVLECFAIAANKWGY